MEGFVYKWVNRLNGRWYIGSHAGVPSDRYIGKNTSIGMLAKKLNITFQEAETVWQKKQQAR